MKQFRPHMADKQLTVITGNYGSGKTEVAVNFTLLVAAESSGVRIADLDLVNPYFRCREATELMEAHGVEVVAPREGLRFADLPIILPEIKGMIEAQSSTTVLDVGGDPVGARVLSSFASSFTPETMDVLVVVNGNRPFTDTPAACHEMIEGIEEASRLKVTGLVGNTHLMEHTDEEVILEGEALVVRVAGERGIDVRFVTADRDILEGWSGPEPQVPVLPLTRHMAPPWIKRVEHGPELFKI